MAVTVGFTHVGASAQESSPPIVKKLELDESAVVGDVAASPQNNGISFNNGELTENELFIRYWPDQGTAEVFLSLMVVAEIEGCPASWSTLNQTPPVPVVVDSSGLASAVIVAEWLFERQLPSGGATCLGKELVSSWDETFSIDLSFSADNVSASIAGESGVPLLTSTLDVSTSAPPSASSGDTTPSVAPATQSGTRPSNLILIVILIFALSAAAGWLVRPLWRRFFRG